MQIGGNGDPAAHHDGFVTDVGAAKSLPFSSATEPDFLGNDEDPDGDTLSVVSFTQPEAGTGTLQAQATSLLYTPPAGFEGDAPFTYTVSDGHGGFATASAIVSVGQGYVGDHPLAVEDSFEVPFGWQFFEIPFQDLLANDLPSGELQVAGFTPPQGGALWAEAIHLVFAPEQECSPPSSIEFDYTVEAIDSPALESTATVTLSFGPEIPSSRTTSRTASASGVILP